MSTVIFWVVLGVVYWLLGTMFFMRLTAKWSAENIRNEGHSELRPFPFSTAMLWPVAFPLVVLGLVFAVIGMLAKKIWEKVRGVPEVGYFEGKPQIEYPSTPDNHVLESAMPWQTPEGPWTVIVRSRDEQNRRCTNFVGMFKTEKEALLVAAMIAPPTDRMFDFNDASNGKPRC